MSSGFQRIFLEMGKVSFLERAGLEGKGNEDGF
jgi:hypothetical protein